MTTPRSHSLRSLVLATLPACSFFLGAALLATAPASAQTRVHANGDSITFGVGASDGATRSYAPVLAGLLGPGYTVSRDGTGGATLLRRGQPSFFNTQGVGNTVATNPDVITIFLGTNDSKAVNWIYRGEFVGDYLSLVDTYRAIPSNPQIFLVLPPPAGESANFDIRGSVIANEVIPLIFEAARQRDLRIIDVHTPFADSFTTLFPDGIHPNDEGHRIIATQMRDAIVSGRSLRPIPPVWRRGTIGPGAINGADALDENGNLIVLGAGATIGGTSDAFRFVVQPATGDTEVTARVLGQRNVDPLSTTRGESSAGVTMRADDAAGARHFSVVATVSNGVSLRWREADGANSGVTTVAAVRTPVWVRVRRVGNVFTGYYSNNGNEWRQIGQPRTLNLPGTVQAGVLANSGVADELTRARFEQVAVTRIVSQTPPPIIAGDGRTREGRRLWSSPGGATFRPDYVEDAR
jgi:lysophospholipase L1-like esterase